MAEKLTPAQAQIVADIIKKFVQERLEPIDLELAVHVGIVARLKEFDPNFARTIDERLNDARTSPALRELMHQKYHVDLETRLRQFVEGVQDMESMEQILRDLKPGQIN
jgi:hypothetical protein